MNNKDQVKAQVIGEIEEILEGLQKRVLADRLKIQATLARLQENEAEQPGNKDCELRKFAFHPDELDSIARNVIETNREIISSLFRDQM